MLALLYTEQLCKLKIAPILKSVSFHSTITLTCFEEDHLWLCLVTSRTQILVSSSAVEMYESQCLSYLEIRRVSMQTSTRLQ